MKTVQDYLDLITSEYEHKQKFVATVSLLVSFPVYVQGLLQMMIDTIFDLDNPPVGDQLDKIGMWVGVSRQVPIPIPGVFFTWDDTDATGWNFGTWQPHPPVVSLTALPDDAFLTVIRGRISANQWDGTTEGAYKIWENVFPNYVILINDFQDMSYDLAIVGAIIDSLTQALLTGGFLPLRPEGIQIRNYLIAVDTNPAFAWDLDSTYLKGWDEGSWLKVIPGS